ncbi:MAG: pentapeptide repeat-containing protein [Kiloniellales bacterium]|nr:pentapeptide repeat-containing protein [Kiloniellales bacterium]
MVSRSARRMISAAILAASGFALAGCELFRANDLDAYQAADCAQQPSDWGGLTYYGLGKTGPQINWSGCGKAGADLRHADLNVAWLIGADLSGADLRSADLSGAKLGSANLSQADLRGALMIGADLQGSDLSGADLRGLDLGGISLRGADLSNAKLNGANLRGVNLTEAKLDGADLSSAKWVFAPAICVEGSLGDCQY